MANDIEIVAVNVGALSNAKRPLFKIPSGYSGMKVVAGHVVTGGAGTSTVNLIDLGTSGTAVAGTVATMTESTVFAANAPQAFTVSATPFLEAGRWLGIEELNVGALNTVAIVSVELVAGK